MAVFDGGIFDSGIFDAASLVEGNFSASAVIYREQATTSNADAVLKRTITFEQGWVEGGWADPNLIGSGFGISASAVVSSSTTVTDDLQLDAVVLRIVESSLTQNAVLQALQTSSFTAEAEIDDGSVTISDDFAADAVLWATVEWSLQANAVLRRTQTSSWTADAIIKRTYPSGTTPTYGSNRNTYTGAAQTSVVVQPPVGTVAGSTILAAISFDALNDVSTTYTPPDDSWTQVVLIVLPNGDHGLGIWKKTATASEPSSYTFTRSPLTPSNYSAAIWRVQGNPNKVSVLTSARSTVGYYHYIPPTGTPDKISVTAPTLAFFLAAAPISTSWTGSLTEIVDNPYTSASLRISYANYGSAGLRDKLYAYSSSGQTSDLLAYIGLSVYVMPTADAVISKTDILKSFTANAEIYPRRFTANARFKLVGGNAFYAEAKIVAAPTTGNFSGAAITQQSIGSTPFEVVGSEPFDRVVADSWGTGPFGTWEYADTGVFSVDGSYGLVNNGASPAEQNYSVYNEVELIDGSEMIGVVTLTSRFQWPTLPTYGSNSRTRHGIEAYAWPDWWNSVYVDIEYSHQVEPAQTIFHFGYYNSSLSWVSSNTQIALPSAGDWYYLKIEIDIQNQTAAAKFWEEGSAEPDWVFQSTSSLGIEDFTSTPWHLAVYSLNAQGEGVGFGGIGIWKYDYFTYSALMIPGGIQANAVVFKTTPRTLIADAWIQASSGTFTWGGAWTADAHVLLGTQVRTFSGSAVIKDTQAGPIYLNAVLFKPATIRYASFLTSAWVIGTVASFLSDAQISSPSTTSETFTYEFSTSLIYRHSAFTADALIASTETVSFAVDAYLGRFFRADAFLVGTVATMTADATLWKTMAGTYTANAAVGYSCVSASFTSDAWLMGTVAWFCADAVVFDGLDLPGSFTADAVIYTLSFTADAFIPGWFTANAYIREETTLWFDEDGIPSPRYPKQRQVQIFLRQQGVITEITEHVVFGESEFTQHARTAPGTFTCVLRGEFTEWEGGEDIWVEIDGLRQFGGLVLQVTYGYWFGDKADPRTTLFGTDYNIYLDRLILWNKATTSPYYKPPPVYPVNSSDRSIIRDACRDLTNLPSGFDYDTYVDTVDSTLNEDEKWMVNTGQTLRAFMTEISKITNAVWWIDQYLNLHYHSRSFVTAPYPITDGGGGISCQNLKYVSDTSSMINDIFVYGTLSATTEGEIYLARRDNDETIARHGLRQYSEIRSDLHTTRHVNKRANSIRSRRSIPIVTAEMDIFESGFFAGQVVELKLNAYSVEKTLVIRESTLSFPIIEGRIDGKYYGTPKYSLKLGLEPDDPWNIYDMLPWDMPDWPPFPAWDGMDLLQLFDWNCPIPMISGGTGGQMDIGWSSDNPTLGSRPWERVSHSTWYSWGNVETPTVYAGPGPGAGGVLLYANEYGSVFFRLWELAPPIEIVVEFSLVRWSTNPYNDDNNRFLIYAGNNDPYTNKVLAIVAPSGKIIDPATWYSGSPTVLAQVDSFAEGERMLLRVLHSGSQTFFKLWKRAEGEPTQWSASIDSGPVGGDYINIRPYSTSGLVSLYGVTATTGFSAIPEQQVWGSGGVDVTVVPYVYAPGNDNKGHHYGYTWAAPPDADLNNFGAPWVGWVNPDPIASWTLGSVGAPHCQVFCEYKEFTEPTQPGLVKSISQDAGGILLKRQADGQWPLSVRISGEIVWERDGYNQVQSVPVTFGIGYGHTAGTATPSWHGADTTLDTLTVPVDNGDFWTETTNWLPFEFEVPVNQALASVPPGGTDPVIYVWCWIPMAAEGSTISSYFGQIPQPGGGVGWWTAMEMQNYAVHLQYPPPIDYYHREPPLHFCTPASEGADIQFSDSDKPIWGWYTEYAEVVNGSFSSTHSVVRGYFSVWYNGERLMPGEWTANSSTSFTLSADYVNQHNPFFLTLTYLIDAPGIPIAWEPARSTTRTDVRLDGKYPPGVRGID